MSHIRNKAIEGLKAGDTFSISRTFTEAEMIQFADISKDYNPVHFDQRFAATKNFKGRICHGLLIAGMVTEIGGQIGWLASGMTFNFRHPVYFGDTITCNFVITDVDEKHRAKAEAVFTNDKGVIVLESVLTGILPGDREKRIMRAMQAEGDPTNKLSGG